MTKIVTSCQDCLFAEYTEKTQSGCKANLIEKYVTDGLAVEAYNEEGEFYIIPGVACLGKMPKAFAEKAGIKAEDALEFVKNKMQIQWQAIIILNDEDIKPCLDALSKQSIKPENVSVILAYNSTHKPGNLAKWLKQRSFKTWRVMETENPELSRGNLVDLVLDKYVNPFYMVLEPTRVLEDDFMERLNKKVNEELVSFGILKMKGLEFTAYGIHKYFNGNSFGKTLEEKLIEEKCQNKIVNLEL